MLSTVEQATLLAEIGNLAARYNLVEIAEACWREAKDSQATVGRKRTLARWMGCAIDSVTARLLAIPILQEYDAFHS